MAPKPFDLSGVGFVKRIVIGSNNPAELQNDAVIAEATALLNRCLGERPTGRILGIEKSFSVFSVGEHSVVLQWMTYHVGFEHKPFWLHDES